MRGKVLIVDDNADNRKLLAFILDETDLSYMEASTAEEGLELLRQERFDAVLMDISLPTMQGDEAIAKIRGDATYGNPLMLAVTAHAIKGERERILACGADGVVVKPVDEDELLSTLERKLKGAGDG